MEDVKLLTFLNPFLDIVVSENTNGTITVASLDAVAKFFTNGLINASRYSILPIYSPL